MSPLVDKIRMRLLIMRAERDRRSEPMVRDKVVEDGREEDREALLNAGKMLVKFAELVREAIAGPVPDIWYARAEALATIAMEFDPPTKQATLHELRNVEQFLAAEEKR